MTNPLLQLEQYFFPHQEVRANPSYDPSGNRSGTHTAAKFNISRVEDRPNVVIVECILSLDESTSENPIYFFKLHVFGLFVAPDETPQDVMAGSAATMAIPMLIGAARERLAELTARAPWGPLLLGTIPIQIATSSDSPAV